MSKENHTYLGWTEQWFEKKKKNVDSHIRPDWGIQNQREFKIVAQHCPKTAESNEVIIK